MMARPTPAEHYRQHNREMKLALELGITPLEAKHELRRRDGLARISERQRRLDAMRASFRRQSDTRPSDEAPAPESLRDLPDEAWMMRD